MLKKEDTQGLTQRKADEQPSMHFREENTNLIEKGKQVDAHLFKQPSIYGQSYTEFPIISIFLHFTFFMLLVITFFTETNKKPLYWICGFFYVGIQFEGIFGDIPAVFRTSNIIRDILPIMRQWRDKWLDISFEVGAYHYSQRNVHGQKRRGKQFSFSKITQLEYTTCEDVSEDVLSLISKYRLLVVTRDIRFSYGNDKSEEKFNQTIAIATEEAKKADKFSESSLVVNLKDNQNDIPTFIYMCESLIFVNKFFFWITSLLLLTIPYRLYVNSLTGYLQYKLHKKIYV